MKKLPLLALCSLVVAGFAVADDWPQFRGPNRDGISKETGLLKEWPKDGPPLAWQVKGLGGGYSAPSVAAGRIFGMSYRGADEVVWALDEKDGKEQWATIIASASKNIGSPGQEGPRCTPTVDGDLVYALGTAGDLVCLKIADGTAVWHKNLEKDFGGHFMARWGYCESPLVDGDKLVCTPGGKDATVVALDKKTGDVIWKAQVPDGNKAGYASPIVIEAAGHRQYVAFPRRRSGRVRRRDREAAVALQERLQPRRQLRHADLFRRLRFRGVGLRRRRRPGAAERRRPGRRQGRGSIYDEKDAKSPRRRDPVGRLSLRRQRRQ